MMGRSEEAKRDLNLLIARGHHLSRPLLKFALERVAPDVDANALRLAPAGK